MVIETKTVKSPVVVLNSDEYMSICVARGILEDAFEAVIGIDEDREFVDFVNDLSGVLDKLFAFDDAYIKVDAGSDYCDCDGNCDCCPNAESFDDEDEYGEHSIVEDDIDEDYIDEMVDLYCTTVAEGDCESCPFNGCTSYEDEADVLARIKAFCED